MKLSGVETSDSDEPSTHDGKCKHIENKLSGKRYNKWQHVAWKTAEWYVGGNGGEEGKGQRATIKKGIHRKQANEEDKT